MQSESVQRPLDVLYLTHNYPRHTDDFAGRFIARLARLLTDRGQCIGVLAPHHPGAKQFEEIDGIRVWRFRYASDANEQIAYRGDWSGTALFGPRGIRAHYQFMRAFTNAAGDLIRRFRPRALHAHWWVPGGWVTQKFARRIPMLLTMHGTDLRMLELKPWTRMFARRVWARARIITAVSSWLAETVHSIDPTVGSKLRVAPMPVDDGVFRCSDDKTVGSDSPVILCVTRFTRQKRNEVLLSSLAKLKAQNIPFRARLVGEGGDRQDSTHQAIAEHNLSDDVELIGSVSAGQLANEYRQAAVTVLPSVGEGFGMALVEAQLCRCAVVGVRSGGIIDIIEDQVSGLLAEPDDSGDLARALATVLTDAETKNRLAAAGRESAMRRFSSDAVAGMFLDWYNELRTP